MTVNYYSQGVRFGGWTVEQMLSLDLLDLYHGDQPLGPKVSISSSFIRACNVC